MKKGPRLALWLIAAIVAGGVAFAVLRRPKPAETAPVEAAVPVVAGAVTQRDMPILINALGTVQSIQAVNVQSRVNGQIMQAFFKQGELVKAGDPLFLIDPRPYQAALDQAQAQLEHDQALVAEAKTDLARYQKLEAENSIAQQQARGPGVCGPAGRRHGQARSGQRRDGQAQPRVRPHQLPRDGHSRSAPGRSRELRAGRGRHDACDHHPDLADLCDLPHPAERTGRS